MLDPLVQVPAQLTSLSEDDACNTLRAAFIDVEGRDPTPDELAMLLSQSALETAKWTKMHNWNWGNSVTTHGGYFLLDDKVHRYAVYPSAEAGARKWLGVLKDNFAIAWSLIGAEDTKDYAAALKHGRYGEYYEADTYQYIKALDSHYQHMLFVVARNMPTVPNV